MKSILLAITISFSMTARAEIQIQNTTTEALVCEFPDDEFLQIQKTIDGIFPTDDLESDVLDAAKISFGTATELQFIKQGRKLIFRDQLPSGESIDYKVTFDRAQGDQFFITMSQGQDVTSQSGINMLSLSPNSMAGSYGQLTDAPRAAAPLMGVCFPETLTQRYIKK